LAVFQAAEFFVCSRYSLEAVNIASRLGFVAITFLPPLSIHIANETAGRRNNWAIIACYIPAFVLAVIFSILPNTISSTMCTGRYVIFQLEGVLNYVYPIYYFGLLFGILGTSFYLARKEKNQKKRYALLWLMVGTLSFMIPTAIVYWVVPDSAYTIPSVMCGFAIIYAFILTTKVAPVAGNKKSIK
jgi:RsiW-degrading membrane proteinase PrsW (M82 family)